MGQGLILGACEGGGQYDDYERSHGRGKGNGEFRRPFDDDDSPRHERMSERELNQQMRKQSVEKAREWQRSIRSEHRQLERDINRIRNEEVKLKREITAMASKGQMQSVQTLAKQVVKSRKSVARLEQTKCSLNALNLQLTTSIASASAASAMKMSAGMMKEMNRLASVPELQRTMEEMRTEMARAEVADEMMEEFHEESEDETEVDAEVQKVMDELILDRTQQMGAAAAATPAAPVLHGPPAPPRRTMLTETDQDGRGPDDALLQRMQALQAVRT